MHQLLPVHLHPLEYLQNMGYPITKILNSIELIKDAGKLLKLANSLAYRKLDSLKKHYVWERSYDNTQHCLAHEIEGG